MDKAQDRVRILQSLILLNSRHLQRCTEGKYITKHFRTFNNLRKYRTPNLKRPFSYNFRFAPYCSDVSYNSTYTFPNSLNVAALASAAAAASNSVASAVSVSGATGTTGTSTGCTSDWPDYGGVDSTTSPPFESRSNDLSSLGDSDHQVNISSGNLQTKNWILWLWSLRMRLSA